MPTPIPLTRFARHSPRSARAVTAAVKAHVPTALLKVTDQPNLMATLYSQLHQNIQDSFNAGGVEINPPHYGALRDGNEVTIPEGQRPPGTRNHGFRMAPRADP